MGITVLGPVSVDGNGALGPRDRVVLSVLALRPGEAVGAERMAEALWGDEPPPSWHKVVPGCVMRLRRALGPEAIATTPHGYRLTVPADDVDAQRFERLVGRGRELLAGGEADRAAHTLGEALALWQGRPLVELEDWAPGRVEAARLDGVRLDAEEQRWAAELAAGRHDAVLAELSAGVADAPLRERRWGQLALAEYRCGCQGDALRTIHRARATLVDELGVDPGPELVALERAILLHDPALLSVEADPVPSAVCPYLGLVPYDVGDAEVYFGREREAAECLRRISAANLLTVAGPSGSGKSSLVRAGVAAALQRTGRVVSVITPGRKPLSSLAGVDPNGVLVVDQCEEATVLCTDGFERAAFFDALAAHATDQPVIVAMRADRLGDLAEHPAFARLVEMSLYLLGPLGDDELRAAIERPARSAGLALEPGLVDVLVQEVEGEPGALPLLSHALRQTWERREGRTLTVEGYRATGGIRGAVAHSAEALYEQLPEAQRDLLRTLLLRLVAITPDGQAVRTRMPRRMVAIDADHERLVERLVTARLATADETTVELAHESLARAWPRLRGWLDDDVGGQRILRHLVAAADAWDALGRPASELYRGDRLAQALTWRDELRPDLGPVEHAFLDAGRDDEDRERRAAVRGVRARRRGRALIAAVAVLVVAGVVAAIVAVRVAADRADDERTRAAGEARRASALALAGEDPGLAALLAVEAVRLDDNVDTRATLHSVLQRDGRQVMGLSTRLEPWQLTANPADGTLVVSGIDGDGNPLLSFLDPIGPGLVTRGRTFDGGGAWPHRDVVEFRPDGTDVAITAAGGLQLLDTATLEPMAVQPGAMPTSAVADVAYSGDGRFLAASFGPEFDDDSRILVWDLTSPGAPILEIDEPGRYVPGVALSPDGGRLYVVGHTHDVVDPLRAHDVASGAVVAETELLPRSRGGCCPPLDLEISPDGGTLAVLAGEHVVLYRTGDLREQTPLETDDTSQLWWDDVEYSHGGDLLAVTGPDGVAVWDVAMRRPWLRLPGTSPAFGPDDASVHTIVDGGVIAQWDLARDRRPVRAVAEPGTDPSPADGTGTSTLDDDAIAEAGSLGFDIAVAAVSPDGDRLAVVGRDGEVGIRRLDDSTWVRPPIEAALDDEATSVSYAPDGRTFVVADAGGEVQLWDDATGSPIARLRPGRPGVSASAGFHTDGHTVVIETADGAAFHWDTSIEATIAAACASAGRNMTQVEWREAFPGRPYRETCMAVS